MQAGYTKNVSFLPLDFCIFFVYPQTGFCIFHFSFRQIHSYPCFLQAKRTAAIAAILFCLHQAEIIVLHIEIVFVESEKVESSSHGIEWN